MPSLLAILPVLVAILAGALATVWFVPALRAKVFKAYVKLEADKLEKEEVEELQEKAGLGGEVDTASLLQEKDKLAGVGLGGKFKEL